MDAHVCCAVHPEGALVSLTAAVLLAASRPVLQDINPVTYQLIMSQRCVVLFVGDQHQHIYGFNNAVDGFALLAAEQPEGHAQALTLSHTFRLGPAVAEAANRWVAVLLWTCVAYRHAICMAAERMCVVCTVCAARTSDHVN